MNVFKTSFMGYSKKEVHDYIKKQSKKDVPDAV